jgi:hypothetical protein
VHLILDADLAILEVLEDVRMLVLAKAGEDVLLAGAEDDAQVEGTRRAEDARDALELDDVGLGVGDEEGLLGNVEHVALQKVEVALVGLDWT